KELHTRASDEDKPKDDKSSELENLLTTINKFIVCSADGDVEEENGKSNAETNSESPSSTKDNLKSLELTDSDATLELNEGTEQKNPASGDKKKEIQTDSSHGETEKELEENDNHSQEMEIIENDRVADDFSDNSKRKNLSSAEDILSEDEEDNAVQSIKILMEETEKVTKSLMKSKREKKKDATRKQNREGKLSGVVDDLKSKKSSEVNLAAKKSLLQDTDSDDDVINSKGSDSVSASFSDDSSDNVKKEDHGSIVDRFYTSCTDDKLRQRPLVKIKKCCEILSPEKLCTEKAMSPEKNASDDPDQIDREIANLTNLKSLKKKKKKKSVDVGDPRS
ncbi:ATRX (predicted), partial [Pycnogonum litorale]